MLYVYDTVLDQIKKEIGDHRPERGGALLGERGKPIITKFIFDKDAHTTTSTYSPSRKLNEMVQNMEESAGLEFKGIIHSHPGGYDQPSIQDMDELATGLKLNPHLPSYLVPIVTTAIPEVKLHSHELIKGEMKVSFYGGFQVYAQSEEQVDPCTTNPTQVSLQKMKIRLVPEGLFTKDLEEFCRLQCDFLHPEVFSITGEGELMLTGTFVVKGQFDVLLLVDAAYPNCCPRILVTDCDGNQEEMSPSWSIEDPFMKQLSKFIFSIGSVKAEC